MVLRCTFPVNQKLNPDKYEAIFRQMCKTRNIKILNLQGNSLSSVDPELFGSAVSRVHSANLRGTRLCEHMLVSLFTELAEAEENQHLRELDISYNFRMENVCPNIFSAAVVRLSSVNLKMCRLHPVHITKMIESAVSGNSQLRDVNLSDNLVCLIDDHQNQNLAVFVSQLRSANFSFCRLRSDQLEAILVQLNQTEHQLVDLDLGADDLSSVSPEVITAAIRGVEKVSLLSCKLTAQLQTAIFHLLTKPGDGVSKLKHLDLRCNPDDGRARMYARSKAISEELLSKVSNKIPVFKHGEL